MNQTVHLPDLGPYRPIKLLGEGGMASVYLAMHPHSNKKAAVKLLHEEVARNEEAVNRFLNVARALKGEHNPHIAEVLGSKRLAPDKVILVMEYVQGQDLGQVLVQQGGRFQPARVLDIAIQITDGLRAAHERGVLHLDLKPENVFVLSDGDLENKKEKNTIKILDFGVALLSSSFRGGAPPPSLGDQILGTPEYWSPEQASGGPVDPRSDMYSLGVLMYELLAGETPFRSHSVSDVIAHHMRTQVPPLPRFEGEPPIPAEIEEVVLKCLAKDPPDRFATAAELLLELRKITERLEQKKYRSSIPNGEPETFEVESNGMADGKKGRTTGDSYIGKLLDGKYRLQSLLGEGGMGKVYLAEHILLGRRVAVKMLRREYSTNKAAVQRFFQEARAVNRIAHPHIIEVTDFVQDKENDNYYIMEFLDGQSLDRLLMRQKKLSADKLISIALQVCSALASAHRAGIVHRDLKPENIFIVKRDEIDDYVKLLDFGVAKLLDRQGESIQTTRAGAILGTPEYMSPEQAASKPVDQRTDIYALGIIMYEMATGKPPFKSKGIAELLVMHLSVPPAPPSEIEDPGYPVDPGLEQVIMKCLEKEPQNRFQSMEELADALRHVRDYLPTRTGQRKSNKRDTEPTKSTSIIKRPVTFGLAALALIALVAGFFLVKGNLPATALVSETKDLPTTNNPQSPGMNVPTLNEKTRAEDAKDVAGRSTKMQEGEEKPEHDNMHGIEAVPGKTNLDSRSEKRATAQVLPKQKSLFKSSTQKTKTGRSIHKSRTGKTASIPRQRKKIIRKKHSSRVKLTFSSTPKGALVFWSKSKKPLGRTPFSSTLAYSPRKMSFTFKLAGHATVEKKVPLRSNGQIHVVLKQLKSDNTGKKKKAKPSSKKNIKKSKSTKPSGKKKKNMKKKAKGRKTTADPF
ncbi:MAG: serine/threonine protein kinase [Deltaproteobacteria bacterium]|nr:serine/threonine protein kinase [Deltaproteobacteria bacterium]